MCPRGPSLEGSVLHHPLSSTLGGHYGALWTLLEQRAQLLFVHEYARRARSAAGFVSRLKTLLEGELRRKDPGQNQVGPQQSLLRDWIWTQKTKTGPEIILWKQLRVSYWMGMKLMAKALV